MRHLFLFLGLLLCSLQLVQTRRTGGIVHDVVDDYDPDEFEALNNEGDQEEEIDVESGWGDGQDEYGDDSSSNNNNNNNDDDDDDDFGDDDDDDEFSAPAKKKPAPTSTSRKSKKRKQANAAKAKATAAAAADAATAHLPPPTYYVEYAAMAIILLYAMMYFIGSSTNEQKATSVMEALYPLIRDQFHMVGELTMAVTETSTTLTKWEARKLLTKESQSQYRLYATGRQYVKGIIIDMVMIDRQDLIFHALSFCTGTQDVLTVEIPMDETYMAPFVLAIVPSKEITTVKDDNDDIKALATEHKQWRAYLPNHLELLSDANFRDIAP